MHIEEICYSFLLMAFAFDSKKKWEERWGHAKKDEEKGKYIKKSVLKHLFLYIYCLYKFTHCALQELN